MGDLFWGHFRFLSLVAQGLQTSSFLPSARTLHSSGIRDSKHRQQYRQRCLDIFLPCTKHTGSILFLGVLSIKDIIAYRHTDVKGFVGNLKIFTRFFYRTETHSGIPLSDFVDNGILDCVNFGSESKTSFNGWVL